MQTFTIGFGRVWWTRAFGRSPLVRITDRVEAWVPVVAALIVILATPIACAIGTSVHDAHAELYAARTQTTQQVTATATETGSRHYQLNRYTYSATATWTAMGREHVDAIDWPYQAKTGDQRLIWVNAEGQPVQPPRGRSSAAADAVAVALSIWFGVAAAAAALMYTTRLLLDRRRHSDWEREVCAYEGGRKYHE